MLINKKIFITGGAGYLGKKFIQRYYDTNEITIFSRDEAKHYFLKKEFPNIKTIVGDIRNYDLLKRASKGHEIGVFAASLKQIEAVDQNVEESIQIIINGSVNSRRVAEENQMEAACFISSDKSRAATTLYGSMKFVAGESFIVNAGNEGTRLSSAIYGNVVNSTGSIIPLIWQSIKNKYELKLYSEHMTRFMITADDALDLIEFALKFSGYNIIPQAKSFKVKDLFDLYKEKYDFHYSIGVPRISEKIDEIMISEEESSRVKIIDKYFVMHHKNTVDDCCFSSSYSSKDQCVSKEELKLFLETNNYYKE